MFEGLKARFHNLSRVHHGEKVKCFTVLDGFLQTFFRVKRVSHPYLLQRLNFIYAVKLHLERQIFNLSLADVSISLDVFFLGHCHLFRDKILDTLLLLKVENL